MPQTKKEKLAKYLARLQHTRTEILRNSNEQVVCGNDRVMYGNLNIPTHEAIKRVDCRISEAKRGLENC